jgi:hypothetical protein
VNGAEHLAGRGELLGFGETCDTEVRDDRASGPPFDQNVLGLDVAMDDAARVGVSESQCHIAKLTDRLRECWTSTLGQPLCE